MAINRIIFEKGIEVGPAQNSVKLSKSVNTLTDTFAQVGEKYKVRPILLTENIQPHNGLFRDRHSVLTLDGREQLNVLLSSLKRPQGMPEADYIALFQPTMNLQYVAGALVYHCQQIALFYSDICGKAIEMEQIFGHYGDAFNFQDQAEPYYEFDALITSARRTYDALRYILWPVFGSGKGTIPSNFRKTLSACNRLPESLRDTLLASWSLHGEKLTEYRDCIQHYTPVTFGIETASLQKVDGGSWSVLLRIPDNPEAKSQRNFQFANGLDVLTYGWEIANEVITVATTVFNAIPGVTIGGDA